MGQHGNGNGKYDFIGLAHHLKNRAREIVPKWLPGGTLKGREWVCGSIYGEEGSSCSVNIETGAWADFATGDKGGDLISLYATQQNIPNAEAYTYLARQYDFETRVYVAQPMAPTPLVHQLAPATRPSFTHPAFGEPKHTWRYDLSNGEPCFYVARYETPTGDKSYSPFSWDPAKKAWQMKSVPAPRPLYRLPELLSRPHAPVLIVEGEKAADAAFELLGTNYVVTTWPNGSMSFKKTDLTPLHGRQILIWPDADDPGIKCATEFAQSLIPHCPSIKIINVEDMPSKWDAADALASDWDFTRTVEWAKPRVQIIAKAAPRPMPEPEIYVDPELPVPGPPPEEDEFAETNKNALYAKLGVEYNDRGQPVCNVDNVCRVFEKSQMFRESLWFDTFHQRIYTNMLTGKSRPLTSEEDLNILVMLQRRLGMSKLSLDTVRNAVEQFALAHKKSEPYAWLKSLKWDGVPRIDNFFQRSLYVENTEYMTSVSKNLWLSLAVRILRPGSKVDTMVVLIGSQGIFKSTLLSVIGGPWYTEATEQIGTKDFALCLNGKLLIEIGELDAFRKADITTIKRVLSCQSDFYRAPYDRRPKDNPRQCVFVGTTNKPTFLTDSTGGRRFWPVDTSKIDVEYAREMREQLFAEACHRIEAGEQWYNMPIEATALAQENIHDEDPWMELIREWLLARGEHIRTSEIAIDCLKIDEGQIDRRAAVRIADIMRKLGWKYTVGKDMDRRSVRIWLRAGALTEYVSGEQQTEFDVAEG